MEESKTGIDRRVILGISLGAVLGALVISMSLGSFLIRQYRTLQLQSAADAGGLYIEGFLAPHAHEFFSSQTLSDESKKKLEELLTRLPVIGHFELLKIWDRRGSMVYSTDGTTEDEDENPTDLQRALDGDIVVELYTEENPHPNTAIPLPFLEIHAPIMDKENREIIAVGEVYQDATAFFRQRAVVERSIWSALGLASAVAMLGVIAVVMTQRKANARQVAAVLAISRLNEALREAAVESRIEASRTNERLLNQIGAELHDGPLQMMSLLMLTLGTGRAQTKPPLGMEERDIAERVVSDLREISTGLVLPEISDLTLEAALGLAISRHREFTGHPVEVSFTDLPERVEEGLKICCYRMVQEGLMNSHHHAGGRDLRVLATATPGRLEITVRDGGAEAATQAKEPERHIGGIGLSGLRQRLKVFNGRLDVTERKGGGRDLTATIPLD